MAVCSGIRFFCVCAYTYTWWFFYFFFSWRRSHVTINYRIQILTFFFRVQEENTDETRCSFYFNYNYRAKLDKRMFKVLFIGCLDVYVWHRLSLWENLKLFAGKISIISCYNFTLKGLLQKYRLLKFVMCTIKPLVLQRRFSFKLGRLGGLKSVCDEWTVCHPCHLNFSEHSEKLGITFIPKL